MLVASRFLKHPWFWRGRRDQFMAVMRLTVTLLGHRPDN